MHKPVLVLGGHAVVREVPGPVDFAAERVVRVCIVPALQADYVVDC